MLIVKNLENTENKENPPTVLPSKDNISYISFQY